MFKPGDQVKVRRLGYAYHGIITGPDDVIDFSGGSLLNTGRAQICSVSMNAFLEGGRAQVVDNGRSSTLHWQAKRLPPEEIVARARWLATCATAGSYRLVGSNCEHVATWCATEVFESNQARNSFLACGLASAVAIGLWATLPARTRCAAVILGLASPLAVVSYQRRATRWCQLVLDDWPGNEVDRLSD